MGRFFSKGDALLKWYYIFASFLFLNLCGVGYAYYVKFYKNKNNSENASSSSQTNKVIVLPPDTIYVDKINAVKPSDSQAVNNSDESQYTKESMPVSQIERSHEHSYDVKNAESKKSNPSISKPSEEMASASSNASSANNKPLSPAINTKNYLATSTVKSEEDNHTYLISLGSFKVKENALGLIADMKQKGVEAEIILSNHFAKMPPSYVLVLAGKELSSASANQMCNELKKKGIDCYVQDGGKYSWR